MLNATSSVSSAKICSGVPIARLSSVGMIEPSIEFSMGTHAIVGGTVAHRIEGGVCAVDRQQLPARLPGHGGTEPASVICNSAASVKVPAGPRYAMLATTTNPIGS